MNGPWSASRAGREEAWGAEGYPESAGEGGGRGLDGRGRRKACP